MGEPIEDIALEELNKKSLEEVQTLSGVEVNQEVNESRAKEITYVHQKKDKLAKFKTPEWQAKVHRSYEKSLDRTPSLKYFSRMTEQEYATELEKLKADLVQQYLYGEERVQLWDTYKLSNPDMYDDLIFFSQENEPYTNDKKVKTYKRIIDLTDSPYRKEVAFLVYQNSGGMFTEKPEIVDPKGIMQLAKTYVQYFDIDEVTQWIANSEQGRLNIADIARKKWEDAGEPVGRDAEFWIAAEKEYTNILLGKTKFTYPYSSYKAIDVDAELKTRTVESVDCPEAIRNSYFTASVEVIGSRFKVTVREGFPKSEWIRQQEAEGSISGSAFDNMRWQPPKKKK